MITIPILRNFNHEDVIGTMQLDETKLPVKMDYVFALSYFLKGINPRSPDDQTPDTGELCAVSLQTDEQYIAYLKKQKGTDTL